MLISSASAAEGDKNFQSARVFLLEMRECKSCAARASVLQFSFLSAAAVRYNFQTIKCTPHHVHDICALMPIFLLEKCTRRGQFRELPQPYNIALFRFLHRAGAELQQHVINYRTAPEPTHPPTQPKSFQSVC